MSARVVAKHPLETLAEVAIAREELNASVSELANTKTTTCPIGFETQMLGRERHHFTVYGDFGCGAEG